MNMLNWEHSAYYSISVVYLNWQPPTPQRNEQRAIAIEYNCKFHQNKINTRMFCVQTIEWIVFTHAHIESSHAAQQRNSVCMRCWMAELFECVYGCILNTNGLLYAFSVRRRLLISCMCAMHTVQSVISWVGRRSLDFLFLHCNSTLINSFENRTWMQFKKVGSVKSMTSGRAKVFRCKSKKSSMRNDPNFKTSNSLTRKLFFSPHSNSVLLFLIELQTGSIDFGILVTHLQTFAPIACNSIEITCAAVTVWPKMFQAVSKSTICWAKLKI